MWLLVLGWYSVVIIGLRLLANLVCIIGHDKAETRLGNALSFVIYGLAFVYLLLTLI